MAVFPNSPNYGRKTDNSVSTYLSRKKAGPSTFSLDELFPATAWPGHIRPTSSPRPLTAISGLSPYKCQDPDTLQGGGDHLLEA